MREKKIIKTTGFGGLKTTSKIEKAFSVEELKV